MGTPYQKEVSVSEKKEFDEAKFQYEISKMSKEEQQRAAEMAIGAECGRICALAQMMPESTDLAGAIAQCVKLWAFGKQKELREMLEKYAAEQKDQVISDATVDTGRAAFRTMAFIEGLRQERLAIIKDTTQLVKEFAVPDDALKN